MGRKKTSEFTIDELLKMKKHSLDVLQKHKVRLKRINLAIAQKRYELEKQNNEISGKQNETV